MLTAISLSVANAGSASAAMTHWAVPSAGTGKVEAGLPVQVVGAAASNYQLQFSYGGIRIDCGSISSEATAENPIGGGAGTLSGMSLVLKSCSVVAPASGVGCIVKNGELPFNQLTGLASEKAGTSTIKYSTGGSYYAEMVLEKCSLAGTYKIGGAVSAREQSPSSGLYEFNEEESELTMQGGYPVDLIGLYQANTKAGQEFYSSGQYGTQYWFAGGEGTSNLAEGSPTGFHSSEMQFTLAGSVAGIALEIGCSGGSNGLAGTVENPAGGGAGVASGAITFSNCSLAPSTLASRCKITGSAGESTFNSNALSGNAASSALTLAPTAGTTLAQFKFTQLPGGKPCPLGGASTPLAGSIIATAAAKSYLLSGSYNLTLSEKPATIAGLLPLQTAKGDRLRLVP
jgi:hypothetical protein